MFIFPQLFRDFPGGPVVKSCLPIDPWSGKIPHTTEQLSPCATTTEPALQSPGPANHWAHALTCQSLCALSLCSATREASTTRSPRAAAKSSPRLPQLEKAHVQRWRPSTAKKKFQKYHKKVDWKGSLNYIWRRRGQEWGLKGRQPDQYLFKQLSHQPWFEAWSVNYSWAQAATMWDGAMWPWTWTSMVKQCCLAYAFLTFSMEGFRRVGK